MTKSPFWSLTTAQKLAYAHATLALAHQAVAANNLAAATVLFWMAHNYLKT